MGEPADPISVSLDVGAVLDGLGVPWVIGGSLASSMHGEPRSTQDIDVVVALAPRHAPALTRALSRNYYVDAEATRAAVAAAGSFNAIHFGSLVKVDFFVAGDDPFEAERLAQRLRVDMGDGGTLYVDTAEHTVLRKLEWYRRGGETSERQWRDVQAIVRIQGSRLDRLRMTRWAERLDVSDLLTRLLKGA